MSNKSFYNYDNNIEVLNEGFFDFVWKWTKRLFHSLFKADSFSSLYNRVVKLENLIKYGEVIKESKSVNTFNKINESRSRTRKLVEDGENDNQDASTNNQTQNQSSTTNDSSIAKSDDKIEDPNEIDLNDTNTSVPTVNMNNVNMNIPSFPQVAKQLLNGLKDQMDRVQSNLSVDRLKEDLKSVQNGAPLSQRYVQTLEILVTDFLRKYSAGQLVLPRPQKDKVMSQHDIEVWKKYSDTANSSRDKMFKYVYDSMERIVNDYEKAFNEEYNNLKEDENSFIKKYKDGEQDKSDRDFLTEWDNKITSKIKDIKEKCIEYIPTAILDYFITNEVYKNASDYIQLAIQLLVANSKNTANGNNAKNGLLDYVSEWVNGNEDDVIDIIDNEKNNILSKIKGNDNYKQLEDYLNNINPNRIKTAIQSINNIKGIQKMQDKDLILLNEKILGAATNNENISLIIALLIYSINNNFKFEIKNIGNIFELNIQNVQNNQNLDSSVNNK